MGNKKIAELDIYYKNMLPSSHMNLLQHKLNGFEKDRIYQAWTIDENLEVIEVQAALKHATFHDPNSDVYFMTWILPDSNDWSYPKSSWVFLEKEYAKIALLNMFSQVYEFIRNKELEINSKYAKLKKEIDSN